MGIKYNGKNLVGLHIGEEEIVKRVIDGSIVYQKTTPFRFVNHSTENRQISLETEGKIERLNIEVSNDGKIFRAANLYDNPETVPPGGTLYVRGNNIRTASGYPAAGTGPDTGYNVFHSGCTVYGNVMDLLGGAKELTLPYQLAGLFEYGGAVIACELPSPTVTEGCYVNIFHWCNIIKMPKLPAQKLAHGCYNGMYSFSYLIDIDIPKNYFSHIKQLAPFCFNSMFALASRKVGSEYLPVTPADLPSKELAVGCYRYMYDRTSVTTAPDLPAEIIPDKAYEGMFFATKVKNLHISAKDLTGNKCYRWLSSVDGKGNIVAPNLTFDKIKTRTISGLPYGWTLNGEEYPEEPIKSDSLYFYNPGSEDVKFNITSHVNGFFTEEGFRTSEDGINWSDPGIYITQTIKPKQKLYVRSYAPTLAFPRSKEEPTVIDAYHHIDMDHPLECRGNIGDLIGRKPALDVGYEFCWLFHGFSYSDGSKIITAPDIPYTTSSPYCMYDCFSYCKELVSAPKISFNHIAKSALTSCFTSCTSLVEGAVIDATTAEPGSMDYMYKGCTKLNKVYTQLSSLKDISKDWLLEVASVGDVEGPNLSRDTVKFESASEIPYGWTLNGERAPLPSDIFYFYNPGDTVATLKIRRNDSYYAPTIKCKSSLNGYDYSECDLYSGVTIEPKQKLYLRGDNPNGTAKINGQWYYANWFECDNPVECHGNLGYFTNIRPGERNTYETVCNYGLFMGMTTLLTAPDILNCIFLRGDHLFEALFSGCTSLTTTGIITIDPVDFAHPEGTERLIYGPSTLVDMYSGCTSLKTAIIPEFDKAAANIMNNMYSGCTSLNQVTINMDSWNSIFSQNWLLNVSPTGNVIAPKLDFTKINYSTSAVPDNWTLNGVAYVEPPLEEDALRFYNPGTTSINLGLMQSYSNSLITPLRYSTDNGSNWSKLSDQQIEIASKQTVYVRGGHANLYGTKFTSTGPIECHGNIKSLSGKDLIWCPRLFSDAEFLLTVPDLPKGKISSWNNFSYMFSGCTSLTEIPKDYLVGFTELTQGCFKNMFSGCSSLTTVLDIPYTKFPESCFEATFYGCSSLTTISNIKPQEVGKYALQSMYGHCTSLVDISGIDLPYLPEDACMWMFSTCTSLKKVGNINIDGIDYNAIYGMFTDCTSLEEGPEISIKNNLNYISSALKCLYEGCTSLKKVILNTSEISKDLNISPSDWLKNVAPQGEIIAPGLTFDNLTPDSVNGVPENWLLNGVKYIDKKKCIKITNNSDAPVNLSMRQNGNVGKMNFIRVNEDFTNEPYDLYNGLEIAGKSSVYLTGENLTSAIDATNFNQFTSNGPLSFSGDIMLLFNDVDTSNLKMCGLFKDMQGLISSPEMEKVPVINPNMFEQMYMGCSGLLNMPKFPSISANVKCYSETFAGCSSIENASTLYVKPFAQDCLNRTFADCSRLQFVSVVGDEWNASYSTDWLTGVSSTGTITTTPEITVGTGVNQIPENSTSGIPMNWKKLSEKIITVGAGTQQDSYEGFGTYYRNSLAQYLYRKEDINIGGSITSIFLEYSGYQCDSDDLEIWMSVTDNLNTDSSKIIDKTKATMVFKSNNFIIPQNVDPTFIEFTLNTPFEFDNTKNLLVTFIRRDNNYYTGTKIYSDNVSYNCGTRIGNDSDSPVWNDDDSTTGTLTTNRPNIKFKMTV